MKYFFIIFLVYFVSGCVPKIQTVEPEIEGKVVDAQTHQPLAGVSVGSVRTDEQGKFFIEGKKELGIGTTMGGVWRLPAIMLLIEKDGYQSTTYVCEILSTQDGCYDVEIELQR